MSGNPLRLPLTGTERDQVGKLLGVSWALPGRGTGAKAVGPLGTALQTLLATIDGPLRDRRARAAEALSTAGIMK